MFEIDSPVEIQIGVNKGKTGQTKGFNNDKSFFDIYVFEDETVKQYHESEIIKNRVIPIEEWTKYKYEMIKFAQMCHEGKISKEEYFKICDQKAEEFYKKYEG